MPGLASFDVFDTCLTRRVVEPTDVFYEVARRILLARGSLPEPHAVEEIVSARIRAERQARADNATEDTTLEEIWNEVASAFKWPASPALPETELDVEAESLSPISAGRELVACARSRGERILFVSDMYLPAAFIRQQLLKHGFALDGDGFYVSSEVGKTKSSGNLFRHLLEQERVSPADVCHVGDNEASDYRIPQSLGIRAQRFPPPALTAAEQVVIKRGTEKYASSRIAGAMRTFRLAEPVAGATGATDIASQFVGPFAMAFAAWVLTRAQARGIKRLYFLSRDCQLVWKVAQEMSPRFGNIDCRYLFMSRRAIYLPSAASVSPEGMPWTSRPEVRWPLLSHLETLDLTYDDVLPYIPQTCTSLTEQAVVRSVDDWAAFWKLLQTEPLRSRIEQSIRDRRAQAHAYFQSAGVLDGAPATIVDLGWHLTGQAALNRLLRQWEGDSVAQGIYLGLKQGRMPASQAGASEALFYENSSQHATETFGGRMFARQGLLEHILGCADHASVQCYESNPDGTPGPVFMGEPSESYARMCYSLHEAVVRFVRANIDMTEMLRDEQAVRATLGGLAEGFFRNPSAAAVALVADLPVTADPNLRNARPLAQGRKASQIVLDRLCGRWPLRRFVSSHASFWPEGDLALSSSLARRCDRTAAAMGAAVRAAIGRA